MSKVSRSWKLAEVCLLPPSAADLVPADHHRADDRAHQRGLRLNLPLLLIVPTATLVARTIKPRSIYNARPSEAHLRRRLRERETVGDADRA